jgi:hypothetical protein
MEENEMKKALVTPIGGLVVFLGTLAIVDWQVALVPVFQGLALALVPPLLYILIAWGPQNFASAFVAIVGAKVEKLELEKARALFASWGSATMIWSAAASLVSLASMCRNLTEKSRLGYYLMISMTTLIYALLFSLVVCLSGRLIAERRLLEEGGRPR